MVHFKLIKKYDYLYIEEKDLSVSTLLTMCSSQKGIIYVLNKGKLIGIVGKTEIAAIRNSGEIVINTNGTHIKKGEHDEEQARLLFLVHMNWSGIPVIDEDGKIVYEYEYSKRAFYDDLEIGKGEGISKEIREKKIIISITTHDERLKTVYLTLKSLMFQTVKADEIILYLAKGSGEGELVREKELENAGVSIVRGVEDITCHKKYFYVMAEKEDCIVITADDDNIYDDCFVEELVKFHRLFPKAVICRLGDRIKYDGNNVEPYIKWDDSSPSSTPERQICIKSYAGVLYPPGEYRRRFLDKETFLSLSEFNDDLWITACLQEYGISVFNIGNNQAYVIDEAQEIALWNGIETANRNDIYVRKLRNHFRKAYRNI